MKMRVLFPLICVLLATSGCSGSVERWITNTRVHQGDSALENGSASDALVAYQLALTTEPQNQHARNGFVEASALVAQDFYAKGDFEDALAAIAKGAQIDPGSVRLSGLKAKIDQAKLKREIVISNYPAYADAEVQLTHAYTTLDTSNKQIVKNLQRFNYTFDTDDLTRAIKQSYELQLELAKNTNRLITYRQLVESGVPEAAHNEQSSTGAASLLPLP